MARDLDNFPIYDKIVKPGGQELTGIWSNFLSSFIQTLQGYLSQNGLFVPYLTTVQRDALNNAINGQLIYNTTTNKFQGYENGVWVNLI